MRENMERREQGESLLDLVETPPSVPEDERPFPSFRYNPVHDLESLWWIAASFAVHQLPPLDAEHGEESARSSRAQRQLARNLFWTDSGRLNVLRATGYFAGESKCLHQSVSSITAVVSKALRYLIKGYKTKEYSLRDDPLRFNDRVHRNLIDCFYEAVRELDGPEKDIPVDSMEYELVSI